eukprot:3089176-Rhodomonas_salina.1
MQLREALAGDEVVARMYARVFAAHVAAVARGGAGAVLTALKKRCRCRFRAASAGQRDDQSLRVRHTRHPN